MSLAKARKLYFDPTVRGSLSSRRTFQRYHPNIPNEIITKLFQENVGLIQWFPAKVQLKGETHSMTARYFSQYLMMDVGFFHVQNMKGYKIEPVLGLVDVWSRLFVVRSISKVNSINVLNAFKDILKTEIEPYRRFKDLPMTILTDKGTEFVNQIMTNWLKTQHKMYSFTLTSSSSKTAMVERRWRTLKAKYQLLIDASRPGQKRDFDTILQEIAKTLNNMHSRILGDVTPNQLREFKHEAVEKMRKKMEPHLYWSTKERKAFYRIVESKIIARIGQFARITSGSKTFQKLQQRKYNKLELFIVRNIKFPIPSSGSYYSMYKLRDLNGEVIEGYFKTSEIVPVPIKSSPHNSNYKFTVKSWKRTKQRGIFKVHYAGNILGFFFKLTSRKCVVIFSLGEDHSICQNNQME